MMEREPNHRHRRHPTFYDDNVGGDANGDAHLPPPNATGWIAFLDQLAAQNPTLNAVRVYMYELDRRTDYAPLLRYAASLGICVLVPLTSRSGPGVLSRTDAAPKCYRYPAALYGYGATCLDEYWDQPNVVARVMGNEVMNDLDSWEAAPCVTRTTVDAVTGVTTTVEVPRTVSPWPAAVRSPSCSARWGRSWRGSGIREGKYPDGC